MMMNSNADTPQKPERALHVLALNSGSSSLKFGLYRVHAGSTDPVITGEAEAIGETTGAFHAKDSHGHTLLHERELLRSHQDAIARVAKLLSERNLPAPQSVGHRIVHGGPQLKEHCRIDDSVLAKLEAAAVFASLHMPAALSVIRFAQSHFPGLVQVACFDTSFHAHMPPIASVLPVPRALRAGRRSAIWLSWTILRIHYPSIGGERTEQTDNCSPRQWRQRHRREGRHVDRYQHGADPDGWDHYGNAAAAILTPGFLCT